VIKGALRAEKPDLLTVILPQSLSRQPAESQELLSQVGGGVVWWWGSCRMRTVVETQHLGRLMKAPLPLPPASGAKRG
jgi:hypothetical protein